MTKLPKIDIANAPKDCGSCENPCDRHMWCLREANDALRAATEAVAKARDGVVEAAKAWDGVHATTSGFHALEHLRDRLILLHEAEQREDEARARLEALR